MMAFYATRRVITKRRNPTLIGRLHAVVNPLLRAYFTTDGFTSIFVAINYFDHSFFKNAIESLKVNGFSIFCNDL